jgi:hypothetical protein
MRKNLGVLNHRRIRRDVRRAKSAASGLRLGKREMNAGASASARPAILSMWGRSLDSANRVLPRYSGALSRVPRNAPIRGVATQDTQTQRKKHVSKDIAAPHVGHTEVKLGFEWINSDPAIVNLPLTEFQCLRTLERRWRALKQAHRVISSSPVGRTVDVVQPIGNPTLLRAGPMLVTTEEE